MTQDKAADRGAGHAGRGRRGTYANGQHKREEFIERALEVFAGQGFRRLSLRRIAEELGTSHAALGYHFPTKESLLEAVLERQSEREGPLIADGLAEQGMLDFLPDYVREAHTRPAIVQLDVTLQAEAIPTDHTAHEWVHDRITRVNDLLADELAIERERGRLDDDLDAAVTARLVSAMMRGLQIQWLYDPTLPVEEDLTTFLGLLRSRDDDTHDGRGEAQVTTGTGPPDDGWSAR